MNSQLPFSVRKGFALSVSDLFKGVSVSNRFRRDATNLIQITARSPETGGAESMVMKFHGSVHGEVRVNFWPFLS